MPGGRPAGQVAPVGLGPIGRGLAGRVGSGFRRSSGSPYGLSAALGCPSPGGGRGLAGVVDGAVGSGGAEVGQVLLCAGQRVGQFAGGAAGVGHVGGCSGDGRAGVGVVVGPDAVGVVFGVQPAAELVQQLRETVDEQDEFGDEPVELGRPGEGVGAAGAMVQFADGLGGRCDEFDGAGRGLGISHDRSPLADAWLLAGWWRCR